MKRIALIFALLLFVSTAAQAQNSIVSGVFSLPVLKPSSNCSLTIVQAGPNAQPTCPLDSCYTGGPCGDCRWLKITNNTPCTLCSLTISSDWCFQVCNVMDRPHYPRWDQSRTNCRQKDVELTAVTQPSECLAPGESIYVRICTAYFPITINVKHFCTQFCNTPFTVY